MASMFRSGPSRRKREAPGQIRVQFKTSPNPHDSDDDMDADDDLPVTFCNGVDKDVPEGTVVVQPEEVEDVPVKKKRDVPARIDTSVLDNVSCTACGKQLNPYKTGALQKHPELKVVICKQCEKFLSSGEISKDEDGADEQCRWCGEGGRLVVCDECSGAFCKSCVMRNLSRSEFNNINGKKSWQCYLCDPSPIEGLRESCRKIRDTLKALHEKEKVKASSQSTSPGSSTSRKSVGVKDRGTLSTPSTKTDKNKSTNSREESPSENFSLLRLEDLNVKHENVETTIDKLFTATNTFREVLQTLRSQSQCSAFNGQQKMQQPARALNKSLETYFKSLKAILTDSRVDRQQSTYVPQDKQPTTKESTPNTSATKANSSSRPSTISSTTLSGLNSRTTSTARSLSEIIAANNAQKKSPPKAADAIEVKQNNKNSSPISDTREKILGTKKVNGILRKDDDSLGSKSKSSNESNAELETEKDTDKSSEGKNTVPPSKSTVPAVTSIVTLTKSTAIINTSINNIKSFIMDTDESSKDDTVESETNTSVKDVHSKGKVQNARLESSETSLKKNRNDSEGDAGNDPSQESVTTSIKEDAQKVAKSASGKITEPDSVSELCEERQSQESLNILLKPSGDENVKEKESPMFDISDDHEEENLAAKFDLIQELADEMLRSESDDDKGGNDDEDLPVTFGEVKVVLDRMSVKISPSKKTSRVSSNESTPSLKKQSKTASSLDAKKSRKKSLDDSKKQTVKDKQEGADVGEASDNSSSCLLMSDLDDVDLSTRKQKRKNRTKRKPAGEKLKTSKTGKKSSKPEKAASDDESSSKSSSAEEYDVDKEIERLSKMSEKTKKSAADEDEKTTEKAEHDSSSKSSSAEEYDVDKEIERLSKMPRMRKRKASDSGEDEKTTEEAEPKASKIGPKSSKRAKPGPKSSKKGQDYEDLSSDDNEKNCDDDDDDVDEDDDEELPVAFFPDTADTTDQKELDVDENELAKNKLLEDMESDAEDDVEDDVDDSSSDENSDADKKTKKKQQKQPVKEESKKDAESEDNDDSDENIGKRKKKIHSKLLDAKLSDSDSDVGKPKTKKPKKEDDKESFKADKSSGSSSSSSSDSDLTDDDDDDSNSSVDDSDDDGPKSKKKGKKGKRKKKGKRGKGKKRSDDEEDEDSDEGGKKNKKGKGKKRKRIKKMDNSSDEDKNDDDDDDDGNKARKRKDIKKIMSNKRLEDSTRAAAKAEEKRRKRIAAKQREFNIETITDENNPMNCQVTTKLVLEAGKEEGDEPLIQVNKKLVRKLKPHQVEAVQFLWDCLFESVKRAKKQEGAGCILAHCMGLGKTLSVIAFVHTILTHEKLLKQRTCLVVSPLNTVLNWKNEWTMWLDKKDQFEVWELASCKQNAARAEALRDWQESGGIMIIGYEMYRNLTTGNRCKNKKQKLAFKETLVDPGPDLVICDEGHILKNEASAISKAMNLMRTKRRVVLTGTPLQNNLNEYHCMVSFVKPNLLGTRKEFNNRFISPIQNGQCTDSTQKDVKLMKARAHVLHEMLAGCVQRRDYSALTKFLPPKQEYVISVRLTNIQIDLYEKYLELSGQGVDGVFTNKGARLFGDYQNLMKIWTHPWVLKLAEIRDELKARYDDDEDFIDDDDDDSEDDNSFFDSSSSEEDKAMSDSGGEGTSSKPKGTRRTRAKARKKAGDDSDEEEVIKDWKTKRSSKDPDVDEPQVEEPDKTVTKDWWASYVTEDDKLKLELSNKLFLLFEILRMCEEIGDKVLIFSQSILSLNIIESFLEVIDSQYQKECDSMTDEEKENQAEGVFGRNWTKNLDYYRMDGSTNAQNRHMWASNFNDIENYRARLFLISTRAGGLGINLVAANRVIIFDASWNPSHDVQSIFRVYRFGQIKPCYIYRFLAQGTMEEKIYERQVTKLSLSQRVVDEHQIERHFSANDLKDMYNFRPDRWDDGTEKPTLALPKDPLLAEILTTNKHCVVSFHEHDSLLENQVEQTLTEEEKKAAWEEYENEKKGIITRGPGTASWPMMAAAQILSREQITATFQALRQQLPDISEDLFQLHLQQALKRQVQIKQEELRKMEIMRLQEINYLNMMKQGNLPHGQGASQWIKLQQLRAAAQQNQLNMIGNLGGMHSTLPMNWSGQTQNNPITNNPISNKPEEAIDLDDN